MGAEIEINRRQNERVETDIGLTCRVPAQPTPVKIVDLSRDGCRIEARQRRLEQGGSIVFDMPNGDRTSGQVMWVKGYTAGIRFSRGLRPLTAKSLGLTIPGYVEEPAAKAEPLEPQDRGLHHWFRSVTKLFS